MGKVIMSGIVPELNIPAKSLGSLSEGSIIKINENGSLIEFYVSKQNYEAELNGEGRTLIVRKDCYNVRAWNSSNVNTYSSSSIDSWLNGTYKALLNTNIQNSVGTTKFKYTLGNGDFTVTTLERAVFLLSATELGRTSSFTTTEGFVLDIANILQIAYKDGSATAQWTRSPSTYSTKWACYLSSIGEANHTNCTDIHGSRPAFTLPSTIKIDENGQVIE